MPTSPGLATPLKRKPLLLGGDPAGLETPGRTRPKEGPFGIAELKRSLDIAKILSFLPGMGPLGFGAFTEGRLDKTHKASTKAAVAATRSRKERSAAKRTGAKTVDQGAFSPGEQERMDRAERNAAARSRQAAGHPGGTRGSQSVSRSRGSLA